MTTAIKQIRLLNSDVITTILSKVFIIFCGFTTSIITARYLGPEGRGNYYFVTSIVTIIVQLGNFGLHTSNTYQIAQNKQSALKLISNSLWVSVIIGIFGALVVLLLVFNHIINMTVNAQSLLPLLLLVPSTLFFLLGGNLLVGLQKIKLFNFFQYFSNLVILIIVGAISFYTLDITNLLWSLSIAWFFISLVLFSCLKSQQTIRYTFYWNDFRNNLSYSMKIYLTALLSTLVLKGNLFILNMYSSPEALGYFSIASQINDTLMIIPTSFGLVLFPNLVQNIQNRWFQTKQMLKPIAGLMLLICVVTVFFANPFINLFFGSQYHPSVLVLYMILPTAFTCGIISIISQYLAANGLPIQLIYIWLIGLLMSIALNYLFIPKWNAIGAALSLSITYSMLLLAILGLFYKEKTRFKSSAILQQA